MKRDEFWNIVERVHGATPVDMEAKCRNLAAELRHLPLEEVLSFERHFTDLFYRAYDWGLWGAAFVIGDGCGDDSFMDFRSTLISLGREAFENALADPDSLADLQIDPDWAQFEGYQYVAQRVYEERTGDLPSDHASHPTTISGTRFTEWEMSDRLPRLVVKYGFKDADWLFLKEQQEREERQRTQAERISNLLLDSGLIPACGLVPPFHVALDALKKGAVPEKSEGKKVCPSFDLSEADYWAAVVRLENMKPEELLAHSHLYVTELRLDTGTSARDLETWMASLKESGLL